MHFPSSPPSLPWRRLLRIALALPLLAAAAVAAPASADTDITVEGLYHTAGAGCRACLPTALDKSDNIDAELVGTSPTVADEEQQTRELASCKMPQMCRCDPTTDNVGTAMHP